MSKTLAFLFTVIAVSSFAGELSPNEVVAQLYAAHRCKHDPLDETQLLARYFDAELLKLYLKDKREAKGEVGRLDGDPLYNAQEIQITDFAISAPGSSGAETRVTVRFKNLGKPTSIECVLRRSTDGWKISD